MRHALLSSLIAAAILVAAVFALAVRAQDVGPTLFVSGLEIGRKDQAILRIRNTSSHAGDVFSLHYTVRHTDAGQSLSQPGAGDGAVLAPGAIVELDLGVIVNAYRAGLELGEFEGPVQFVAFGDGGVSTAFGPETVIVEAIQRDGRAQFAPLVEWR